MAAQSITSLGSGEVAVGSAAGGGLLTNQGNIYFPQSSSPVPTNYGNLAPNQVVNSTVPSSSTQSVLSDSTGPSDSRVAQLQKMSSSGGLNPSQQTELNTLLGQQGPSQDEINRQIDATYNSTNDYLNQAEQNVNSDFPSVQSDINKQFDTSSGQLKATNDINNTQFGTQIDKTNYNNELAQAQARALYNELRTGYQQRFGGATSAGDASNEIANVEQQKQMGQNQRSFNDTTQNINNNKFASDTQFEQNNLALKNQRDSSLNQANRDFQNKLLQISQSRAQNEQAKGQARLQALQDLRNSVNQINLQNQQFQNQLQLYSQFGGNTTGGYNQTSATLLGNANQAAGAYGQQAGARPTSPLTVSGATQQANPTYVGQVGQQPRLDPVTGQWVY